MESRAFVVGLIVGILATVTMDVVAMIALRFGIAGRGPRRTGPDLIGRWIGYLLEGNGGCSSGSHKPVQSHHVWPGYSPVDGSDQANLKFSCPALATAIIVITDDSR